MLAGNQLAQILYEVGVVDDNATPVCDMVLNSDNAIDTIEFTRPTANVEAALSKLKSNLSNGPDGLPPVLFKRLKHCLAAPLALVFTQLLLLHSYLTHGKKQ